MQELLIVVGIWGPGIALVGNAIAVRFAVLFLSLATTHPLASITVKVVVPHLLSEGVIFTGMVFFEVPFVIHAAEVFYACLFLMWNLQKEEARP